MSVTQVGPKQFNGTKFQRRRRKKRSRVKWKEKNNPREDSSRSDGGDTGRTMSVVTTSSPVPQVKVKSMASMMIQGQVEGTPVDWKIDTGARSTFITSETFDLIIDKPILRPVDSNYIAANGQKVKCLGKAVMSITFGNTVFEHEITVGGIRNNLIGEDFITAYRCVWDHDESCFIIKGSRIPLGGSSERERARRVVALETVMVPAGHEAVIKSGLTNQSKFHSDSSSLGILTPEGPFMERYRLALAKTLVDAANEVVYARVFNPGTSDVTVCKHAHIALSTPVCRIGPVVEFQELSNVCKIEEEKKKGDTIPEHLRPMFERGCINLDQKQKERFRHFLSTNQGCFTRPGEVGRTNMGTHKIKLLDDKPVMEPPRRIPMYKRQALDDEVKKLQDRGLIERSSSPWSSQVVMVQKKDGSWRMCVDYRKLNEKTIKDAYPLTRIDENLDTLEGAEWYTSLDLDMAYHQVPMMDEDKGKTAFATPRGCLYQFTTMPFGLCNAASNLRENNRKNIGWIAVADCCSLFR